ncbi:hypothetical protein EGW08_006234, partial [Elysia chlorotica]
THLATHDTGSSGSSNANYRMANGALDVRLRRQTPVSVKPPRLRLSANGSAVRKVGSARLSAHAQQPSSSFGSSRSPSLSKVASAGLSRSCDNVRTSVFSTATSYDSGSNSSLRPLIHHQRHNLKNRFQLLKTLGEGTYGKVKLAADKTSGEQ